MTIPRRLILLALTLCVPSATAAETLPWKTVAGWQIRVDPTLGYGCFLVAAFDTGTIVRIGLNREADNGYLLLMDAKWRSLEVGKEYPVEIKFEGETPWNMPATAVTMGDGVALGGQFRDGRFFMDFARKRFVEIHYNGKMIGRLSLRGSSIATAELAQCQQQVESMKQQASEASSDDPFDDTPKRRPANDDPFAD